MLVIQILSVLLIGSTMLRYVRAIQRDKMIQATGNAARFFLQMFLVVFVFSFGG
ncbi:MAG: hypothetical protein AAGD96_23235 [Chloroflexota bacterium]